MFCRKCGKELQNGAKFCPGCGISIVSDKNDGADNTDTNDIIAYNLTLPEEEKDLHINTYENSQGQTKSSTNEAVSKKKNYLPVVCILSPVVMISILAIVGIVVYSNPTL